MLVGLHFQHQEVDIIELRRIKPPLALVLSPDAGHYINLFYRDRISPDCITVLRVYHDNIMSYIPEKWASICVHLWEANAIAMRQFGANPEKQLHLQFLNEPNLAREHGWKDPTPNDSPEYHQRFWEAQRYWSSEFPGYIEIREWCLKCIRRIRELNHNIIIHSPPLAPGHNPPGTMPGYEHKTMRPVYDLCNVINDHVYWNSEGKDIDSYYYGRRPLRPEDYEPGHHAGLFMQYPERPKIISEYNNPNGIRDDDYADQIYRFNMMYKDVPNMLGTTIFLYNTMDPNHRYYAIMNTNVIITIIRLNNELKNGGNGMDQLELWLKDIWERQGVMVNPDAATWKYAVQEARGGKIIVPCISPDGNYENYNHPEYVLTYTIPPLWMKKGEWVVHEGFPPFK